MITQVKYILQNGIPAHDVFTMHSTFDYYWQKWLMCLLAYFVYDNFSDYGLYVAMFSIGTLRAITYVIFMNTLNPIRNLKSKNMIMCMVASFASIYVTNFRPSVIADILLMIMILLIERYINTGKIKSLIGIPFLSFLIMGFHSTMWPCIFIFMMPYFFETNFAIKISKHIFRDNVRYEKHYHKRPLIIIAIISFAAGALNPYGIKEYWYIVNTWISGTNDSGQIMELQSFNLSNIFTIATALLILVVAVQSARAKYVTLRSVYFFIGGLLLLLMATRNVNYALITSLIMSASALKHTDYDEEHDLALSYFIGLMLLIIVPFSFSNLFSLSKSTELLHAASGKTAVEYMVDNYPSDSLIYNQYGIGATLELYGFKPYIDERSEAMEFNINQAYNVFSEFTESTNSVLAMQDLFKKYDFDYAIFPIGCKAHVILQGIDDKLAEVKEVYNDKSYVIYKLH